MSPPSGFSTGPTAQPVITVLRGKTHIAAIEGMRALIRAQRDIYVRGPELVVTCGVPARAADGSEIRAPGVFSVSAPFLQHELAKIASWQRIKADRTAAPCDPPDEVVA